MAHVEPDVELDEWPTAPGAGTYRGRDGLRQALASWFESWEWMEVQILDLREAGDHVLVTAHQRARGRESQVEVEITSFSVYTFRDGKVAQLQLFTEREPALAAAGLRPEQEEEKR